jgi:hypothetical protein
MVRLRRGWAQLGNFNLFGVLVKISTLATLLCPAAMVVFSGHALAHTASQAIGDNTALDSAVPSVTPFPQAFFADYRPSSAMDMIGRLPGFSFDGGNGNRGFAGTGGNVLIDGERPPSRNDSLSAILNRIPADQVLRIDLIRGGAGGIDMQGHTVVANVIRRKAGGLKGSIAATLQADEFGGFFPYVELQVQKSFGPRSLEGSLTYNSDDFTIRARGERVDGDGLLLKRFKHEGAQHDLSYAGTGVFESPLAGGKLRLNTRIEHHWNESGDPARLFFPGGFEDELYHGHGTSGELGLRYNRDLAKSAALEFVAFQQLSDDSYNDDFSTPSSDFLTLSLNRAGESIADAKLKLSPFKNWNFETGVEGVYNFVDSAADYIVDGATLSLAGDAARVEETREEAFVTATWRPRPKLSIEGGLRYEHSTISADTSNGTAQKSLSFPKPRVVVTWSPSEHHQLLFRVERSIGQLDFGGFSATAAFNTGILGVCNPDIEPNKIWTTEGRYDYRFAQKGSVLLQYTRDAYTDLLARVSVAVDPGDGSPVQYFDITRNLAKTTRNNLVFNTDLPLDWAGMSGGLLSLRASWLNSPSHDPVTFVPRNVSNITAQAFTVELNQNINHLNLSWDVSASTGTNQLSFSPRQIVHSDNVYRLNANMTWKPRPKLALTIGSNAANGGYNHNTTTVWDLPRPIGQVAFVETTRTYSKTQIYVALRQTF